MEKQMFIVNQGSLNPITKAVFTTGDAYLVVDHDKKMIYIWLGAKSSVDEKTVAAVEARRIDDGQAFNGAARIVTIDQGQETKEFMEAVQNLKILDKNLAKSMLKDVNTGEFANQANFINALYRISSEEYEGINAIKYLQVPFDKDSLDSEDCFMADMGVDVWVWQGKDSNVKEKVKAMQYAREFDADRAGGQKPRVFMEGDGDEEFLAVLSGKVLKQDRATADLQPEAFEGEVDETLAYETPVVKSLVKEMPVVKSLAKKTPVVETSRPPSISIPAAEEEPVVPEHEVMVQKGEGRLTCPKCGNSERNLIREVEDPSNIIMAYPRILGKKWICGKCGTDWKKSSL
ncbi:MAG: hypothetical protein E4G98_00120 [Promethearchaeota archaeon]|nr:MAG: hypothetical protein E4G98_00120 [Candidatus Lokiarchaeota archaeon]